MLLRSIDVLHDFYVPEFRAKMDMVPGSVSYFWLTPTRTGTFEVLCAELCGLGHPAMRGTVVVEEADYTHGSASSRRSPAHRTERQASRSGAETIARRLRRPPPGRRRANPGTWHRKSPAAAR